MKMTLEFQFQFFYHGVDFDYVHQSKPVSDSVTSGGGGAYTDNSSSSIATSSIIMATTPLVHFSNHNITVKYRASFCVAQQPSLVRVKAKRFLINHDAKHSCNSC